MGKLYPPTGFSVPERPTLPSKIIEKVPEGRVGGGIPRILITWAPGYRKKKKQEARWPSSVEDCCREVPDN